MPGLAHRQPGGDVLAVEQGIEDLPLPRRHVCDFGNQGVGGAALDAPALLLGVGQMPEVIDSDLDCGQHRRAAQQEGGEPPGAVRLPRCEDTVHAAGASMGPGHAPDVLNGLCSEVAAAEKVYDGPGGPARRPGPRPGRGVFVRRRESAVVEKAPGLQGEALAQPDEVPCQWPGGIARWAEGAVGDAAPGASVARRVGDPAADMPAVDFGDGCGGQFVWVEADGLVFDALVPVDLIAAVGTRAALSHSEQAAGAVRGATQSTVAGLG